MNLLGFLIIFGCLFLGEVVIYLTKLPLPPSIFGLLFLFFLLQTGVVKLHQVQGIAKTLLDYLAFMIVPACISVFQYLDLIKSDIVPLLLGTSISTFFVLLATSQTHIFVRQFLKNKDKKLDKENNKNA